MAGSPRIEELKKKFDENPVRYFAPLANEYRKAGEIEQAIEICRTYLAEKPGHMSGLIVFGQALYEAKRYDEARSTFEQALALDPENLIALRHLGDVARDTGDVESALRWYQRVLDADPRNEEIAEQLTQLKSAPPKPPAPAVAEAAAADTSGSSGWADINPETAERPVVPEGVSPEARTLQMEPLRLEKSQAAEVASTSAEPAIERAQEFQAGGVTPAPAAGGDIERQEEFAPPPSAARPADLGLESMEFTPPAAAPAREESLDVIEFVPPSGSDAPARAPDLEVAEFTVPTELHAPPPPPAAPGAAPEPPAEGEAFVTETMAELYLQQGYRDDALAIYRQLLARNPNDADLRARVQQLESGARTSMPVAAVSEDVVTAAQERHASTSHPTVRSFFSRIAQRRPRVSAGAPAVSAADEAFGSDARAWPAAEPGSASVEAQEEDVFVIPPVTAPEPVWEPAPPSPAPYSEPAAPEPAAHGWAAHELAAPPPAPAPEPAAEWVPPAPSWASESAVTEPPAPEPESAYEAGPPAARPEGEPPEAAAGGLGSLFGGAPVAGNDEQVAARLADALTMSVGPAAAAESAPGAPPGENLAGKPAHAADSELSLDSVFGTPPGRSSGAFRQSGGFSFDQFFSDNAAGRQRSSPSTGSPSTPEGGAPGAPGAPPGPDSEDDAQFNAWLEGLKKK